jgi:DNA-binding MarR family transcriptional regulator
MNNYDDIRFAVLAEIVLLANKLQVVMNLGINDITFKQWLPMIMIDKFEFPPTLNELSQCCGITHQSTKQLVNKLEEKGYVSIEQNPNDKRELHISLTDKSRKWSEQNAKMNHDFVYELFSCLTQDEVNMYFEAQHKLLTKLKKIGEEFKPQ